MGLSRDHGRLIKWHQPDNFAFVEQSRTMKAPVGLLSDRTVLRSKMEGLCPDKFQFAVLGSSRFWGRRSPTRAPSKSNKCPNADPEQQRPKAGYHRGEGILPFAIFNRVWYIQLSSTNRNLSGRGPSILLRKTVLSLKSPTGAFIAPLRCANANF